MGGQEWLGGEEGGESVVNTWKCYLNKNLKMKKRFPPSLEENIKQTNKDLQTSQYTKLWPIVASFFRILAVKDFYT